MGPAAKVGPCPIGVVNNGTGNISLLVPSDMPEGTNERYQNNSNAMSLYHVRTVFCFFKKCGSDGVLVCGQSGPPGPTLGTPCIFGVHDANIIIIL